MRKFGIIGAYIIVVLLAFIGILFLSGCKGAPFIPTEDTTANDSAYVAQKVESIVNPQFTNIRELISFRTQMNEDYAIDSVFRVIPEPILNNVASVLFKKNGFATKKSIVEEYRANSSIYNNLPSNATLQQSGMHKEVDLQATDLGNRRQDSVISTSFSYRTDTINGKPVRIQIKTEESYVK